MQVFCSRMLCLALLASCIGAGAAHAQMGGNPNYGPVVNGKGAPRTNAPTPAPALPGTLVGRDRAGPTERAPSDMPPTEALFDAINRGDIVSARDAMNRGADINGRNVLGLTPLDQSVDLSRNDITFLLMSMRGAQPSSLPAATPVAKETRGKQPPAPRAAPVQQAASRPASAPRPVAQIAPSRPAPGGGGAPQPQSGFLGFGG